MGEVQSITEEAYREDREGEGIASSEGVAIE